MPAGTRPRILRQTRVRHHRRADAPHALRRDEPCRRESGPRCDRHIRLTQSQLRSAAGGPASEARRRQRHAARRANQKPHPRPPSNVRAIKREVTGHWLDDVQEARAIPGYFDRFRAVVETKAPSWRRSPPNFQLDAIFASLEDVFLPLARDGQTVDMILTGTIFFRIGKTEFRASPNRTAIEDYELNLRAVARRSLRPSRRERMSSMSTRM
jgi:hypothetical protein